MELEYETVWQMFELFGILNENITPSVDLDLSRSEFFFYWKIRLQLAAAFWSWSTLSTEVHGRRFDSIELISKSLPHNSVFWWQLLKSIVGKGKNAG